VSPVTLWERYLALSPHARFLLALLVLVLAVELLLGKGFPRSPAYRAWKGFFERLGHLWSVVLLSIIYFTAVGPVAVGMRLLGNDLLDLELEPEPSFWRPHDKSPLHPLRAARHQF
jgi:hypothetical protein